MTVMTNWIIAMHPHADELQDLLRRIEERGALVFSTPRLGEDLIVFLETHVKGAPALLPYNLGRVVSCKFFDENERKFVVRTHRMLSSSSLDTEETVLVELGPGVYKDKT